MKTPNGHEVIQVFERFAPKKLAEQGDPIGLQVGSLQHKIHKVMTTLDVTEAVVEEAIAKGVNLIIAHHPPIFMKMGAILTDTPKGRVMQKLLTHNIAVYAAHTNLDVTNGGVNDWLASRLGLKETSVLVPTVSTPLYKLQVYVPVTDEEQVRAALGEAGAGQQGNYDFTSFTVAGTGRFRPLEGAQPAIGAQHQHEEVEEVCISVLVEEDYLSRSLKAMKKAHPYEEVAYDLWKLEDTSQTFGLGRVGKLEQEVTLEDFVSQLKRSLPVESVQIVGKKDAIVRKVAVLGGSGRGYFTYAKRAGADVYVTGDIDYHSAQYAEEIGLQVVDAGHYIESVMVEGLAETLRERFGAEGWDTECFGSLVNTNPFRSEF